MTKDKAFSTERALDLALEALDNLLYWDNGKSDYDQAREAINAIKQARSAPVQELPVFGPPIGILMKMEGDETRELYPLKQKPAPVQEPVGTYGEIYESMQSLLRSGLQRDQQIYMAMKDKSLYTTPPAARQWVGLTQQERKDIWREAIGWGDPSHDDIGLMIAIEAKLKEKNQ
jgi:hypothetical protein